MHQKRNQPHLSHIHKYTPTMSKEGVEEVMIALAASRRALERRRENVINAEAMLGKATQQANAVVSDARVAAKAIVQHAESQLTIHKGSLRTSERSILKLEEMLFVTLRIIEERVNED